MYPYRHAVRHCRIATQFCNGAMAKLGLGVLLLSWAHAALEDLTDGFHVDVDETSVSAGFAHTCALQDDGREFGGRVVCWGSDSHGQASPPSPA